MQTSWSCVAGPVSPLLYTPFTPPPTIYPAVHGTHKDNGLVVSFVCVGIVGVGPAQLLHGNKLVVIAAVHGDQYLAEAKTNGEV